MFYAFVLKDKSKYPKSNENASLSISSSFSDIFDLFLQVFKTSYLAYDSNVCSAVDVDTAVCIAEELDQLDDVLKIVYKLRHIEMTGRMLPSTEYALIRLLLKYHKTDILLAVLADPVSNLLFKKLRKLCLMQ